MTRLLHDRTREVNNSTIILMIHQVVFNRPLLELVRMPHEYRQSYNSRANTLPTPLLCSSGLYITRNTVLANSGTV